MSPDPVSRLNSALEGRYHVERQLGEGGMATVYLARDEKLNRNVALKVLKPELAAVVGAERFLAEIRTTASLQHPHILPLHDSGEADGLLFYVMPYVEGESLKDRIHREGPLPVDQAVRIARECARALVYAHRNGVVHRDVKPANVLVSEDHAVLADFGIAQALGASTEGQALTATGMSVGTTGYMSPEQASGERPVDGRADVYGVGCVLYEMLTGERAFSGATPFALMARQLEGPRSVSASRPSVPEWLDEVVQRALQPTPGDRFQSADDVLGALERSPTSEASPRDSAAGTTHVRYRTGRVVVAGVAAVSLLAAGWFGWRPVSEDEHRLAVLPFDNLSPDPEHGYFAAGLHDQVTRHLAGALPIPVMSRAATAGLGGSSPAEVAELLGVSIVLAGSARIVHDSVVLGFELIDASTSVSMWNGEFEGDLRDVLAVQAEVTRALADALQVEFAAQGYSGPVENRTAYLLFLQARELSNEALSLTGEARSQRYVLGIDLLQQSLDLERSFAPTHATLAIMLTRWLYTAGGAATMPETTVDSVHAVALAAAEEAVRLDDSDPLSHAALAHYRYFAERDLAGAFRDAQQILDRSPTDLDGLLLWSAAARRLGRVEEAAAGWALMTEVDPLEPQWREELLNTLFSLGRTAEALALSQDLLHLDPQLAYGAQINFHREMGSLDDARDALDRCVAELADRCDRHRSALAFWSGDYLLAARSGGGMTAALASFLADTSERRGEELERHIEILTTRTQSAEARCPGGACGSSVGELEDLAFALAVLGRDSGASFALERAERLRGLEPRDYWQLADHSRRRLQTFAVTGQRERALAEFEGLLDVRNMDRMTPGFWQFDPFLDSLRDDPDFQALAARIPAS